MKIYGVKCEDLSNWARSPVWVDGDVYKTLDAAERRAEQVASQKAVELADGVEEHAIPYYVKRSVHPDTQLAIYQIFDATDILIEQWSVVEFNLVDSAIVA